MWTVESSLHFKTFSIFIWLFKLSFIKQIEVLSDKIILIHNSYSSWNHKHAFQFYLLYYLSLCSYFLADLLKSCNRDGCISSDTVHGDGCGKIDSLFHFNHILKSAWCVLHSQVNQDGNSKYGVDIIYLCKIELNTFSSNIIFSPPALAVERFSWYRHSTPKSLIQCFKKL